MLIGFKVYFSRNVSSIQDSTTIFLKILERFLGSDILENNWVLVGKSLVILSEKVGKSKSSLGNNDAKDVFPVLFRKRKMRAFQKRK